MGRNGKEKREREKETMVITSVRIGEEWRGEKGRRTRLQVQPGFNATTLSGDGIRKRGNRNEKLESLCPTTVIGSGGDVRGGYR